MRFRQPVLSSFWLKIKKTRILIRALLFSTDQTTTSKIILQVQFFRWRKIALLLIY